MENHERKSHHDLAAVKVLERTSISSAVVKLDGMQGLFAIPGLRLDIKRYCSKGKEAIAEITLNKKRGMKQQQTECC